MRMFDTGFFSPYATCHDPQGPRATHYFPAPFHWLYGIIGAAGATLNLSEFHTLGIANGLALAIFLLVMLRFFHTAAPHLQNLPFLLYTLAGGLAGIATLIALPAGLLHDSAIQDRFWPIFAYELIEGPHATPILYGPRLYYTTALALAFAALTACITARRIQCTRHLAFAAFLLLAAAFLNPRFAGFTWLAALVYLLNQSGLSPRQRITPAIPLTIALLLGATASYALMLQNPAFVQNTGLLVRQGLLVTPFVTATLFHLILIPPVIRHHLPRMTTTQRLIAFPAIGYLAAFLLLYTAHKLYYLNPPGIGEAHAAIAISGWALLGALAAILPALRQTQPNLPENHPETRWITLWLLLFLPPAIAAFGQGWFLQFTPQRLLVFIMPPLAILAAQRIHTLAIRHPHRARAITAAMITAGLLSITAGALIVQGPLAQRPGQGPFPNLHAEFILPQDAQLLAQLPPQGIILAPYRFTDVIPALNPGLQVLGGVGATDLTGQLSVHLQPQIDAFFQPGMTPDSRLEFLQHWCIGAILLPATWPVHPQAQHEIQTLPNLHPITQDSATLLLINQ